MKKWLCAVLLAPHVAWAGTPGWCKTKGEASGSDLGEMKSDDANEAVSAVVKASCTTGSEIDPHRAEVDAARAAWSKKLGMIWPSKTAKLPTWVLGATLKP